MRNLRGVSAFEVLETVVECGVHFVGILGEEGEDGGAVFDFEGVDFLFDFDAAGNLVVEAFPDDRSGNLLLEIVLTGVCVVEYFLIEFFVAGVDVDLMADKVVTNYCIYIDTVRDPKGFANPVVAYRGIAGVEAVMVLAVLDEFSPKLFAALVTGLSVIRASIGHLRNSGSILLNFGIVKGFGDVSEDVESFGGGDVEEFSAGADAKVCETVDGFVNQPLHLGVLHGLEGCIDLKWQRNRRIVQLLGADIDGSGALTDLHPVFLETGVSENVNVAGFFAHITLRLFL